MTYANENIVNVLLEVLSDDFKIDYSSKQKYFQDAYENHIKNGENDILIEFNDSDYPNIRLINESHYNDLDEEYDDKPKANICLYGYYMIVKNGKEYDFPKETIKHADLVIAELLKHSGVDYSLQRLKIEKNFNYYLMNGHWDSTVEFENKNYPDLRFIQEDEYDQHMDDNEKPDYDLFVDGHYIIIE